MSTTFRSIILVLVLLLSIQNGYSFVIDHQALDNLYHQYKNLGDDIAIDQQTVQILNESATEMSYGDFNAAARMVSVPKLLLMVSKKLMASEIVTEIEKTKINYHILRRLRYMKAWRSIETFEKNITNYALKRKEEALYCLSRVPLLRNPKSITRYLIGCYNKALEIDEKLQILKTNQELTSGFFQEHTLAVEKAVYHDIRKNEQVLDGCLALAEALKYVHLRKKSFNYCLDNLKF